MSKTSEPDGTGTALVPGDWVTEGAALGLAAGAAVISGVLVVTGSWGYQWQMVLVWLLQQALLVLHLPYLSQL